MLFLLSQDGGDTDSEEETSRLSEIETALRENDSAFRQEEEDRAAKEVKADTPEWHQLHMATETIRVPEILFQVKLVDREFNDDLKLPRREDIFSPTRRNTR